MRRRSELVLEEHIQVWNCDPSSRELVDGQGVLEDLKIASSVDAVESVEGVLGGHFFLFLR